MRMRKKKWAEPWIQTHPDYIYTDPVNYKGKWKELLNGKQLHVEIGMGKGDYLIRMAEMYPDDAWVGIERDVSAAATAARKAVERENPKLENNRMIYGSGENMEEYFAPHEIDVIHLNFSDPWPKKHNHKRRLSSAGFLKIYHHLLKEDGYIRMKTDNKDLFEDSVLSFIQNEFTLTDFSVDYRRREHPEDAVSEYEAKFMAQGQPIYALCAAPVKKK